jgi:pyruvate dehydrogenase E1 component
VASYKRRPIGSEPNVRSGSKADLSKYGFTLSGHVCQRSHNPPELLAITSADRLHAGWTAARRIRRDNRGSKYASHIEKLLRALPRECGIVSVIDGHPATLGWLGGVCGHRMEALGVEHFGQTGTIADLYRHHGIDANAIIDAAEGLTAGAPVRHRKMAV